MVFVYIVLICFSIISIIIYHNLTSTLFLQKMFTMVFDINIFMPISFPRENNILTMLYDKKIPNTLHKLSNAQTAINKSTFDRQNLDMDPMPWYGFQNW